MQHPNNCGNKQKLIDMKQTFNEFNKEYCGLGYLGILFIGYMTYILIKLFVTL